MRGLIIGLLLAFSGAAQADYCLSWIAPTENTDGTPLTNLAGYKLWCIPADRVYGNPQLFPADVTEYKKEWPSPDGDWKCAVSAFNSDGVDSAKAEILFTLLDQDGDGNPEVVGTDGSCTFQPPIIVPPIPGKPATLKITRKGYYTITDPDGDPVLTPEGGIRRTTTQDKAYEYITQLDFGVYTINPPPYEVVWN